MEVSKLSFYYFLLDYCACAKIPRECGCAIVAGQVCSHKSLKSITYLCTDACAPVYDHLGIICSKAVVYYYDGDAAESLIDLYTLGVTDFMQMTETKSTAKKRERK